MPRNPTYSVMANEGLEPEPEVRVTLDPTRDVLGGGPKHKLIGLKTYLIAYPP